MVKRYTMIQRSKRQNDRKVANQDHEVPNIMIKAPERNFNDPDHAEIAGDVEVPATPTENDAMGIEVSETQIVDPFYREVPNAYQMDVPPWKRRLLLSEVFRHKLKHKLGIQIRNTTVQTSERQNDDDDRKVANQDQEVPNIMIKVPERNFNDPDHAEIAGDVDVPATATENDADPAVTEMSEVTDDIPAAIQRDTNTAEVSDNDNVPAEN